MHKNCHCNCHIRLATCIILLNCQYSFLFNTTFYLLWMTGSYGVKKSHVLQCDCFWLDTVWAWCGLFLLLLLFCLFNEVKNSQQHNSGGLLLKEQVCLLQKQTCKKQSTIFFVCFGYSHNHTYTYLYSTFILFSSYHKFSIMLNDTLTYRVEEQGPDSQTLVDNPLCLLVSNTHFH